MKKLLAASIVSSVVLGFAGTASADGLSCSDERGCKLCSEFVPGNWRDTVTVAETWSPATCLAYAKAVAGTMWQLGCMNRDSFVFGAAQSTTVSSPNLPAGDICEWGQ